MSAKVRAVLDLKSKLLERYAEPIDGVLGGYDRVILTGTLVDVAHPDVLRARLYALNIRCFDLKLFAEPLRDPVRAKAILLARPAGLGIEDLERRGLRKEDLIAQILEERGRHPGLQRVLGLGSYRTAWSWLHKLRRAMVRPGRDALSGTVEVDETYGGGLAEGKRGRGADHKALVVIAAEEDGKGTGRIRMSHVADASALSLEESV